MIEYPYEDICFDCARELGGNMDVECTVWEDQCPVCKEKKIVASAVHDFGLYYVDEAKLKELKEARQNACNNQKRI